MAGTIPLSLTQQFDEFGKPLAGGLLYIMVAGSVSTPQQPYQDAGLTITMPNPIQLDAAGRVPQFFLADGYVKMRLVNKIGVTQIARDGVLVIGPSAGGGGGGGGVDPTTLIQTGMVQQYYGTGVLTGFVRMNGRTIGSASSGATERANADCQALFNFLWNSDPNLAIVPSRGASSAADWAANKQLTLPDARSRLLMGLGDMGSTTSTLLNGVTFTFGNATMLGALLGTARITLTGPNTPPHQHPAFVRINDPGHAHTAVQATQVRNDGTSVASLFAFAQSQVTSTNQTGITANVGSSAGANDNQTGVAGAAAPFDAVNPALLVTVYIKL